MVRSSALSATLLLLAVLVSVAMQFILARQLGAASFGRFILVMSCVNLLRTFAEAGINGTAVRFISTYHACQEWSLMSGFLRWATPRVFCASLLLSVLLAGFALVLTSVLGRPLTSGILIGSCLLPTSGLHRLFGSLLRALGRPGFGICCDQLLYPLLAIAGLTIVNWTSYAPITFHVALVVCLASVTATMLISGMLAVAVMPMEMRRVTPRFTPQEWRSTGMRLTVSSLASVFLNEIGPLLVGAIVGAAAAGIYAAAARIARLLALGLQAVNTVIAPIVARLYALGLTGQLQNTIAKATWLGLSVTVGGVVVVLAFSRELTGAMGAEFRAGVPILMVLAVGQLVNAACGSVCLMMNMTGNERSAAKVLSVAVILELIGSAILTVWWNSMGAAIASSLTTAFWNILLVWLVYKRTGIWSTIATPIHCFRYGTASGMEPL